MSETLKLAERIARELNRVGTRRNIEISQAKGLELPQESQTGKSTPKS